MLLTLQVMGEVEKKLLWCGYWVGLGILSVGINDKAMFNKTNKCC